jgi:hypothetical protein
MNVRYLDLYQIQSHFAIKKSGIYCEVFWVENYGLQTKTEGMESRWV